MGQKEIFDRLLASNAQSIEEFSDELGLPKRVISRAIREMLLKSWRYIEGIGHGVSYFDILNVYFGRNKTSQHLTAIMFVIKNREIIRERIALAENEVAAGQGKLIKEIEQQTYPLTVKDIETINSFSKAENKPCQIELPGENQAHFDTRSIEQQLVQTLESFDYGEIKSIPVECRKKIKAWMAAKGLDFQKNRQQDDEKRQKEIDRSIRLLEQNGYLVQKLGGLVSLH